VVELFGAIGAVQVHEVHAGGGTMAECSAATLPTMRQTTAAEGPAFAAAAVVVWSGGGPSPAFCALLVQRDRRTTISPITEIMPDGIANLTGDGPDLASRMRVSRSMLPFGRTSPVARSGRPWRGRVGNRSLSLDADVDESGRRSCRALIGTAARECPT
jgi:hypothetical protein